MGTTFTDTDAIVFTDTDAIVFSDSSSGTAVIAYSFSAFGTGDLKTGSPTVTIVSGVATLSVEQTGNIGVGDRITYDTDSFCFIKTVNSSTSFDVVTATCGTPADITDSTVVSIAHEYASLAAASAGASDVNHLNTDNLVTGDYILTFPQYYDHDDQTAESTSCTIDGYTTGASNYIKVYTPEGGSESINSQRHAGEWDDNKAFFQCLTSQSSDFIRSDDDYVYFEGLQVHNNSTHANWMSGLVLGTCEYNEARRCIIKGRGDQAGKIGIWLGGSLTAYNHKVYRNIIYDFLDSGGNSRGVGGSGDSTTNELYNNTIFNCYYGIYLSSGRECSLYNNFVGSCTTCIEGAVGFTDHGKNITSDATSPDGASYQSKTSYSDYFTDYANDDFSLKPTDTVLRNAGNDLGSPYDVDIIGNTVTGTWDIGAFEIPPVNIYIDGISSDTSVISAVIQAVRQLLNTEISSTSQITEVALTAARHVGITSVEGQSEVTTLTFSVVRHVGLDHPEISSEITDVAVLAIRAILGQDVSSDTSVSSTVLNIIRKLSSADISTSSEITNATLSVLRQIQLQNVSSASEITDAVLQYTGALEIDDIEVETQVTSIVLGIIRALNINSTSSNTSISNAVLQAIRHIDFTNVESSSEITNVVATTAQILGITDISVLSQVEAVVLDVVRLLAGIDISIETEVTSPTMSLIRQIFGADLSVETNVGNVVLSTVSGLVTGKLFISISLKKPGFDMSLK